MHKVKSLLLGTVAGFAALGGAQAADMPAKARPVQYVKICSLYGDGFYYIPGTDTCLKLGGYLRVQAEYNMGNGGVAVGTNAIEDGQARFTRDATNDVNYRVRAETSWDVRQQTEYGPLRTYLRFGVENNTPGGTGGGSTPSPYWDRAFLQFAGFTVGRSRSFFDLFTYWGTYTYTNVRINGDTDITGQNLWAYTAELGNGFTASLSLEDPAVRKAFTFDATAAGFFGLNGAVVTDNAFTSNGANFGFRVPTSCQPARRSGLGLCRRQRRPARRQRRLLRHRQQRRQWPSGGHVRLGGRDGRKFNLPGGDIVGVNFAYGVGATGFVANGSANAQMYNSSTSVGVGWLSDGVFTTGTAVELTRAWSITAAYEHVWSPRWRTSWYGGYANIDYNGAATGIINSALAFGSVCARPFAGLVGNLSAVTALAGNSCNPDYSFFQVGSRTQWNPVPRSISAWT